MTRKTRIIKRTAVDEKVTYVIQQKHFIFFWWWVDAWVNSGVDCACEFKTMEEAEQNLCYFDGTKIKEEVVLEIF